MNIIAIFNIAMAFINLLLSPLGWSIRARAKFYRVKKQLAEAKRIKEQYEFKLAQLEERKEESEC
jgi:hypothetical protein